MRGSSAVRKEVFIACVLWLSSAISAWAHFVCVPESYEPGCSYVSLREGPEEDSVKKSRICANTEVSKIGEEDDWLLVVDSRTGHRGWVHRGRICPGRPLIR